MDEGSQPKRLRDAQAIRKQIQDKVPELSEVLCHHRRANGHTDAPAPGTRTLKACVEVQVWQEADGSESVIVLGESDHEDLELKGLLYDGIYAITSESDTRAAS